MASKTICKPLSEQQHKMPGGQVFESASQPPSPLQVPKPSKPENTPSRFPKFVQEDTSTHGTTEVFKGEKSNNHQEAATGPLADRIPPNISEHSGTSDLDASSSDMKQLSVQGKPMELLQLNGTISLEGNSDMKENSEQGSVKDNSVSAKISDGPIGLTKTSGSVKVSDQVESGKSSMYRASTSSDISDESTCCSISSTINKPHKANDSRWEAIQVIRARAGVLGLNHFRLLKRLGCGDIGTVYLSELSGTKCYFAMKVMDKVSLSSRKKLLRAQTERDILQCLDHPFLPTLYTHFETEKFSCLVMEFCPGGDLHTLRQRQPGKYFSEKAVK